MLLWVGRAQGERDGVCVVGRGEREEAEHLVRYGFPALAWYVKLGIDLLVAAA